MTEPITAEVLAAVPAGDDDDVVLDALPLKHPQDYHTGAGFSVIVLVLSIIRDEAPGVVRGFGEFLFAAEFLDECFGVGLRRAGAAGYGVFGPPVADDVFEDFHLAALPMQRHTVRWRFVPLVHPIIAHDGRDAQAIVGEHDVPACGLRSAVGL